MFLKFKSIRCLCVVLILMMSSLVLAQDEHQPIKTPEKMEQYLYIGGLLGASIIDSNQNSNQYSAGPYFGFIFGYQVKVVEDLFIGIEAIPGYSSQYFEQNADIELNNNEFDMPFFIVSSYYFDNGFNVSVKGGLAFQTEFETGSNFGFYNTGWHPAAGASVGYFVDEKINIHAQYLYFFQNSLFKGSQLSTSLITVGVTLTI